MWVTHSISEWSLLLSSQNVCIESIGKPGLDSSSSLDLDQDQTRSVDSFETELRLQVFQTSIDVPIGAT